MRLVLIVICLALVAPMAFGAVWFALHGDLEMAALVVTGVAVFGLGAILDKKKLNS
jgi:hypothetical protein